MVQRGLGWLVIAALVLAACGDSAARRRARVQKLRPTGVQQQGQPEPDEPTAGPRPTEMRTWRVRVYAGPDYRAQTLRWKAKLDKLIERANEVTRRGFAVELEVVDARAWDRTGTTDDLFGVLEDLARLDPGDDVDLVIGLITALPQVSTSLHDLGAARVLGKHMVLRGMNDAAERSLLAKATGASEDAVEKLYQERRAHKELVVFLHEWAHTLGGIHVRDETLVMYPSYTHKQASFSPHNVQIMLIAIAYRDDPGKLYPALTEWLEGNAWSGFIQDEYAAYLAYVKQGPRASGETAIALSADVAQSGKRSFAKAVELLREGKAAEAWRLLQPLTEHYEQEPAINVFACLATTKARGLEYPAEKLCARAAALAPDDPAPLLAIAAAYGDDERALPAVREAQARLERAPPSDERARYALEVAQFYRGRDLVTWLEQAVALLPADRADKLAAWAAQTRARYALPPPPDSARFGIGPASEPDYLARVKAVFQAGYAGDLALAKKLATEGLAAYRDAPGFHVALCDMEMRKRRYAAARKHCDRALAGYDGSSWAHYLTGAIAWHDKKYGVATMHFERAIELDPEMKAAWKQLEREYERAGAIDKRDELRARYRDRFGASL